MGSIRPAGGRDACGCRPAGCAGRLCRRRRGRRCGCRRWTTAGRRRARRRGAGGDDPAALEQDDAVGDVAGLLQVVEHDTHRDAVVVGEVADQVEDLDLVAEVEVGRRLVEEEDRRLLAQARGQPHALALAAGELVDAAVGHPGDPGDVHGPPDRLACVRVATLPAPAVRVPAVRHDVAHRDPVGRRAALGEQRHRPSERLGAQEQCRGPVVEVDVAGVRTVQAGHRAQQGGLATAVRTDQGGDLPRTHVERCLAQDRCRTEGAAQSLRPETAGTVMVCHGWELIACSKVSLTLDGRHLPRSPLGAHGRTALPDPPPAVLDQSARAA